MTNVNLQSESSGAAVRFPAGSPEYNRVSDFLVDEAEILDEFRLDEWLGFLAEDIHYCVPVRQTKSVADKGVSSAFRTMHYDDNYGTLMFRVKRFLETKSAWSEDPRSRTRRLVTNLRVHQGASVSEYEVRSYLLITRNRFESTEIETLTAERKDTLRLVDGELKLARREIMIDMAVLAWPNLSVFL
tara:strand:- start:8504 stop:9064 length:561 start_codon:yes stop_codon:yes gene_type:complete